MDYTRDKLIQSVTDKLLAGAELSFPEDSVSAGLWQYLALLAMQGALTRRQWDALKVLYEHLGGELSDPRADLELGLDTFAGSFSHRELSRLERVLDRRARMFAAHETRTGDTDSAPAGNPNIVGAA